MTTATHPNDVRATLHYTLKKVGMAHTGKSKCRSKHAASNIMIVLSMQPVERDSSRSLRSDDQTTSTEQPLLVCRTYFETT